MTDLLRDDEREIQVICVPLLHDPNFSSWAKDTKLLLDRLQEARRQLREIAIKRIMEVYGESREWAEKEYDTATA